MRHRKFLAGVMVDVHVVEVRWVPAATVIIFSVTYSRCSHFTGGRCWSAPREADERTCECRMAEKSSPEPL